MQTLSPKNSFQQVLHIYDFFTNDIIDNFEFFE